MGFAVSCYREKVIRSSIRQDQKEAVMHEDNGRSTGDSVWSPATIPSTPGTGDEHMGVLIDHITPAVRSVMTTEVYAVAANTSLETAARIMAAQHIRGMPVVRGRTPIGVVSVTDLADPDRARSSDEGYPMYYRFAGGGEILTMGDDAEVVYGGGGEGRVADVMSPFVLSIEASATLAQAGNLMLAENVHRLLVCEGTDLVGIVTSTDLLRAFVRLERPAHQHQAPAVP